MSLGQGPCESAASGKREGTSKQGQLLDPACSVAQWKRVGLFGCTDNRPPCYYVNCLLNGIALDALLDTGSEVCLLAAEHPLVKSLTLRQSPVRAHSINGYPIGVRGEAVLKIQLVAIEQEWRFIVVNGVTTAAVIGSDFLRAIPMWGMVDGRFHIGSVSDTVRPGLPAETAVNSSERVAAACNKGDETGPTDDVQTAVMDCTAILHDRCHMLMPLRCSNTSAGHKLFFEGRNLPDGVLFSKTLVNPERNGRFWVRAVNLTRQPVTLFANQSVGYMEPVLEVFRADEEESGLPTSSLKV